MLLRAKRATADLYNMIELEIILYNEKLHVPVYAHREKFSQLVPLDQREERSH